MHAYIYTHMSHPNAAAMNLEIKLKEGFEFEGGLLGFIFCENVLSIRFRV
jgi:hypothetical protein